MAATIRGASHHAASTTFWSSIVEQRDTIIFSEIMRIEILQVLRGIANRPDALSPALVRNRIGSS